MGKSKASSQLRTTVPPRVTDPTRAVRLGAERRPFRDLYYRLLTLPWSGFFGVVLGLYFGLNLLFGSGYFLAGPGAIHGISPGTAFERFLDSYFFSVQTLATIGYGQMSPHGFVANLLVTIEALTGLMGLALGTGLLFARFSRPTARVRFSDKALIAQVDGVPTLQFRVANERASQIVEAQISVVLILTETTAEGTIFRNLYDLPLERARSPIFTYSWTVMHPITDESPFAGRTQAQLEEQGAQLVVSLTGMDDVFSQTVHARYVYQPDQFHWNRRFRDILSWSPEGVLHIDLNGLHEVE